MKTFCKALAGIAAASFLFGAAAVQGEETKTPDATIQFMGASGSAGVGYKWGNGILMFESQPYSFSYKGFTVGLSVGATKVVGSGEVYNLKNVEDFAGTYKGIGAGMTAIYGGESADFKNEHGVVLHVRNLTSGVSLGVSGGEIQVELTKSGG